MASLWGKEFGKKSKEPKPRKSRGFEDIPQFTFPAQDRPPTPPPKDKPQPKHPGTSRHDSYGGSSTLSDSTDTFIRPYPPSRAGSIYSLSRVSFSSQISQLSSLQLPQAASFKTSIRSISTSAAASRALNEAASQIQLWIARASDVLGGLDAADDVEWAGAAGREGLDEVDKAIDKFDGLIQVYVESVEELQNRQDVDQTPPQDMRGLVDQIEKLADDWKGVKDSLRNVKLQVELAMEWEELCNSVLGGVRKEMEELARQVFEMEERRYRAGSEEAIPVNFDEIENLIQEAPADPTRSKAFEKSFRLPNSSNHAGGHASKPSVVQEDSNLLGLFARMQPLRASLDFLPIKLATFRNKAKNVFPSACTELDGTRKSLEEQWSQLESDAESLRRELGEDRWVLVFRNAGKQALKMIDSVYRSIAKLDESLDSNTTLRHAPSTAKKIENYEAKKLHYLPAIERVMSIIDRGIKDRLTVNGEIMRLQADIQQKWRALGVSLKNIDSILEEYNTTPLNPTQQLRDSLSSIITASDHSLTNSTIMTPGSSPASSSGVPSRKGSDAADVLPLSLTRNNRDSSTSRPPASSNRNRRHSSLPLATWRSSINSRPSHPSAGYPASPLSQRAPSNVSSPAANTAITSSASTPLRPRISTPAYTPSPASSDNKPRWNGSTNLTGSRIGHNFKPVGAATKPSPRITSTPPTRDMPWLASRSVSSMARPSLQKNTPDGGRRLSGMHLTPASGPAAGVSPAARRSASATRTPASVQSLPPGIFPSDAYRRRQSGFGVVDESNAEAAGSETENLLGEALTTPSAVGELGNGSAANPWRHSNTMPKTRSRSAMGGPRSSLGAVGTTARKLEFGDRGASAAPGSQEKTSTVQKRQSKPVYPGVRDLMI